MTKAILFYRNSLLTKVFMLVMLLVGGVILCGEIRLKNCHTAMALRIPTLLQLDGQ